MPPKHVKIDGPNGTALRHVSGLTYERPRDCGAWHIDAKRDAQGGLVIVLPVSKFPNNHLKHLEGRRLVECTEAEFNEDCGYTSGSQESED